MNTRNSIPYGMKSLLECMSRATLLTQPDDTPKFLSTHVSEMSNFSKEESRDVKEVAFRYQEQWENDIMRRERPETPKTAPEDSLISSLSSESFTISPPPEVHRKTRRVSSVRVPLQQESVGVTAEEIPASSHTRPVPPPRGERIKTRRVSTVKVPHPQDSVGLTAKEIPAFPSQPRPVPPPRGVRVKKRHVSSDRTPHQKDRTPHQEESVGATAEEIPASSHPRPVPAPRRERIKTRRVSTVRVPHPQDGVGLTAEEIPAFPSQTRPVPPPRGVRVKKRPVSSDRTPHQKETKPSLPSAWPVLPPIPQKDASQISKQAKGKKSTKGRVSGVITCRLTDCPYHNKPKEGSAVDGELGPLWMDTEPTVKKNLAIQKLEEECRSPRLRVPYRPKGGLITDPELAPIRTRAQPATKRTESYLSNSKKGTGYSRRGVLLDGINSMNLSQVSLESSAYTNSTHTVDIFRYSYMQVKVRPHFQSQY